MPLQTPDSGGRKNHDIAVVLCLWALVAGVALMVANALAAMA